MANRRGVDALGADAALFGLLLQTLFFQRAVAPRLDLPGRAGAGGEGSERDGGEEVEPHDSTWARAAA